MQFRTVIQLWNTLPALCTYLLVSKKTLGARNLCLCIFSVFVRIWRFFFFYSLSLIVLAPAQIQLYYTTTDKSMNACAETLMLPFRTARNMLSCSHDCRTGSVTLVKWEKIPDLEPLAALKFHISVNLLICNQTFAISSWINRPVRDS